jgi:hypothetical protein
MKRLLISAFAVVALLVAATTVLQSRSSATRFSAGTAGMMMPEQVLLGAAGLKQLPIEEFEDQSLVFSTAPKR